MLTGGAGDSLEANPLSAAIRRLTG